MKGVVKIATVVGGIYPKEVGGFRQRCDWVRKVAKLPKKGTLDDELAWVLAFADSRWGRMVSRRREVDRRAVLVLAGDRAKQEEFVGVFRLGGRKAASIFVTELGKAERLPTRTVEELQVSRAAALDAKLAKAREELARRLRLVERAKEKVAALEKSRRRYEKLGVLPSEEE